MFNRIRTIRKRWMIVFTAAALLAVGLVSGAAFAATGHAQSIAADLNPGDADGLGQHDRVGDTGAGSQIMVRVAEILDIEQSTLEAAFQTARSEQADAQFSSFSALLVADGTLTQEQADEADTWFSERPEDVGKLAEAMAGGAKSDNSAARLAKMVSAGKLTQEQAEARAAWQADRPEFLPQFAVGRSDHGVGRPDRDGGLRHHR